jgi:hypothetical protein
MALDRGLQRHAAATFRGEEPEGSDTHFTTPGAGRARITSDKTFASSKNIVEARRLTYRVPRGQCQIDPTQRSKPGMNPLVPIACTTTCRRGEGCPNDLPRLGFHGVPVLSRLHAHLSLVAESRFRIVMLAIGPSLAVDLNDCIVVKGKAGHCHRLDRRPHLC